MYKEIIYKNKINEKLIIKLTKTLDIKEIIYINKDKLKTKLQDIYLVSNERQNKLNYVINKFSKNLEENYKEDLIKILQKYKNTN